MSILRRIVDDKHPLKDMALLVRRAGLEHLVSDPSPEEILALAEAGDMLVMERVAYLAVALPNPAKAMAPFDDKAALRAETKALAYSLSGRNR